MPFTYNLVPPYTDLARIRFYTGDSDPTNPIWDDTEIAFMQSEYGSYQMTTIVLIQQLISKLGSERTFTADWLTVSPAQALDTYNAMLRNYRRQWNIPAINGSTVHTYRPDSGNSAPPNYSQTQQGQNNQYDPNAGSLGGWGW